MSVPIKRSKLIPPRPILRALDCNASTLFRMEDFPAGAQVVPRGRVMRSVGEVVDYFRSRPNGELLVAALMDELGGYLVEDEAEDA